MHPRPRLLPALAALAACAWIPTLPAATFTVTTPAEFQAALTTAAGNQQDDVIQVAAGTYPLTSTLTYTQDFSDSLTIVGADPATTIIDGGGAVQVMQIFAGGAIEVRNLTFRNGRSNGPGGGLYAYSLGSGIRVLNSRFVENTSASSGGGLWARTKMAAGSNVLVEDSLFLGNRAQGEVSVGGGAHIRVPSAAVVTVIDSRFEGNVATGAGGGLRIEGPGPADILPAAGLAVLTRTDFQGNSAGLSASWPGGGASIAARDMNFLDLELYGNRASEGGGLYLQHFTRLYVMNSVFMGNEATLGNGGGLATADVLFATVNLFHNTIFGNRSAVGTGGGAFLFVPGSTSRALVINNIIWGNSATNTADLYVDNQFFPGDVGATVALIGNNASTMTVECTDPGLGCVVTRNGNIDVDPMLVDAEGVDYDAHLLPGSPMIDAGVDTGDEDMPPWDFDGPGVDPRKIGVRPDIGADEFSGEVPPPASADLAVTVTDQPDPVPTGGRLTYTFTVTNAGPGAASMVTLEGLPPQGVSLADADLSQGKCALFPSGALDCGLGDLASGASATVMLVVDVMADGGTTLSYTASVDADTPDPNAGNNAATATTLVAALRADLSASATVTPTAPQVGDTVTFTVTVANTGPDPETAAMVDLTLPTAAGVQSVTPAQGTCKLTSGGRSCLLGGLAAGAQTTVTVTLRPTTSGTLSLGAVVSGSLVDPNTANNSVQRQITVTDKVAIEVKGKGGKGSFGWLQLLGLACLAASRRRWQARTTAAAVAALVAVALSLPAAVEARDGGWYVGANAGAASADYSASDLRGDLAGRGWTIANPKVDDSDTFWKGYVGYAVNEFFAVEAGYVELGETEARYGALVSPGQIPTLLRDTVEVLPYLGSGWSLSAVLSWGFAEDAFAVFGRAGLFVWEADVDVKVVSGATGSASADESGTDAMFGLGLEWRVTPSLALRAEWERYKLEDWVDVPSAGVVWRFR